MKKYVALIWYKKDTGDKYYVKSRLNESKEEFIARIYACYMTDDWYLEMYELGESIR